MPSSFKSCYSKIIQLYILLLWSRSKLKCIGILYVIFLSQNKKKYFKINMSKFVIQFAIWIPIT